VVGVVADLLSWFAIRQQADRALSNLSPGRTLDACTHPRAWRRVFPGGALGHATLRTHTVARLEGALEVRDAPY